MHSYLISDRKEEEQLFRFKPCAQDISHWNPPEACCDPNDQQVVSTQRGSMLALA